MRPHTVSGFGYERIDAFVELYTELRSLFFTNEKRHLVGIRHRRIMIQVLLTTAQTDSYSPRVLLSIT